jgi:hypothetical protein
LGQTSAWALPFLDGTDRPCDTPLVLGRLAERLRTVFDTFDASLAVVQTRPAAMVSFQSTAAQTLTNQNPRVQFSTVDHDNTGQMVDLTRRADRITFNRTAIWAVGGMLVGTTGTAGNVVEVMISAQGINPTQTFLDDNRDGADPGGELFTAGGLARVSIASGWIEFSYNNLVPLTVTSAAMWAFWVADL